MKSVSVKLQAPCVRATSSLHYLSKDVKRREKMEKRRSTEEWIAIFKAAEQAHISQREWCKQHQVQYGTFRTIKDRFRRDGRYVQKSTPMPLCLAEENCLGFVYPGGGKTYYLYPFCLCHPALSDLLNIITCIMKQDVYRQDQVFLFLCQDHKTLIALRYHGNGFSLTKAGKEKGTIPWPSGQKALTEETVEFLMHLL